MLEKLLAPKLLCESALAHFRYKLSDGEIRRVFPSIARQPFNLTFIYIENTNDKEKN